MQERSLKELLQIVLDNLTEKSYFRNGLLGLCYLCTDINMDLMLITSAEDYFLSEYFTHEASESEYYKNTGKCLLFEPKDYNSRVEWLKEKIAEMDN